MVSVPHASERPHYDLRPYQRPEQTIADLYHDEAVANCTHTLDDYIGFPEVQKSIIADEIARLLSQARVDLTA